MDQNKYQYILGIADNCLILGQRLGELCGHGPSLETDIACTNLSLDLLGQVRSYYQYAAQLKNDGSTEDDIAFLRKEHEYKNVLLVEQPNRDFGFTMARQFLFDQFHFLLLSELVNSIDETLKAIAGKAIKEVSYHKRFSTDWIQRFGDGTAESHERIQAAFDELWPYTNELFEITSEEQTMSEQGIGPDLNALKDQYYNQISEELKEATIQIPDNTYFKSGGKSGIHTEHMGFILADMQYMQRTYPNMTW